MAISRPLARSLTSPLTRAINGYAQGGGVAPNPDAAILALFAVGEQGAWYDPSDFSMMWQDSARTTAVTAVGQPVGAINDKSGRGNHATQATSAARPVLQQDGSGKYYLAFDGVDDFLQTAAINFSATNKMTLITGMLTSDAAGFDGLFTMNAGAAGSFYAFTNSISITLRTQGATAETQANYSGATPDTISVLTITGDLSAATDVAATTLRRNGVDLTVAASGGAPGGGNYANAALQVGAAVGVYLSGRLYQFVLRGAASSAGQITSGESYVASKTGITLP